MLRTLLRVVSVVLVITLLPGGAAHADEWVDTTGDGVDIGSHDNGTTDQPASNEGGNGGSSAGGTTDDGWLPGCAVGEANCPPPTEGVEEQPAAASVAQSAYDSIRLDRPKIRMSPEAPNPAIVGLKTWLWLDDGQWASEKADAKAGDVHVTAEVKPVSVVWDLGEGRTVCQGPGRPWRKGLGKNATTDCGFTYRHTSKREPGGQYKVRVWVNYAVTWKCEGDCDEAGGDLGILASPAATADVRVTERQSVVVVR